MEQEIKDIMQRLQIEYDVLPTKVSKEDKAEYIQALIDTREAEDTDIFINCMANICNRISTSSCGQQLKKWSIKWQYSRNWSINGR